MNNFNKYVGQVFTPEWAVKTTLDIIEYRDNILDKKILEPSAGVGNFVLEIIRRMIKDSNLDSKGTLRKIIENLYVIEIDQDNFENLIKNVQYLLKEELDIEVKKEELKNFKSSDYTKWHFETSFDYIVGNPPYTPTKYLPKNSKRHIEKFFTLSDNIYKAFIEKSIKESKQTAYIVPVTIYDDKNFIEHIGKHKRIDFEGNVFTAEILTSLILIG